MATNASVVNVKELIKLVPSLLQVKAKEFWVDYDEGADVLYISFERPQQATETETLDNGVLLRYKKNKLVGVTVMHASKQPL